MYDNVDDCDDDDDDDNDDDDDYDDEEKEDDDDVEEDKWWWWWQWWWWYDGDNDDDDDGDGEDDDDDGDGDGDGGDDDGHDDDDDDGGVMMVMMVMMMMMMGWWWWWWYDDGGDDDDEEEEWWVRVRERIWRFHKSHFIQKFTGKMPLPRLRPERRHTLCASLRSRNACQHFTRDIRRATLYRKLQGKCRGTDWAQNADTHFVRACAVEMHFKISRATLYGSCRWNAADKNEPRTHADTDILLCERAQSKRMSRFDKSHFMQFFFGKMPRSRVSTLIKHRPLQLPQEPFSVDTLFGEKSWTETHTWPIFFWGFV